MFYSTKDRPVAANGASAGEIGLFSAKAAGVLDACRKDPVALLKSKATSGGIIVSNYCAVEILIPERKNDVTCPGRLPGQVFLFYAIGANSATICAKWGQSQIVQQLATVARKFYSDPLLQ